MDIFGFLTQSRTPHHTGVRHENAIMNSQGAIIA